MRILITGGAGFIGSNLANKLGTYHSVIALDNLSFGRWENITNASVNLVNGDIREASVLDSLCGPHSNKVDAIFHFAALSSLPYCQTNPAEAYDVNVTGTLNVMEFARRHRIEKLYFASTSAIYENWNFRRRNPELPPTLIYSNTKSHCEHLLNSYRKTYNGFNAISLRFSNIYGFNQDIYRENPPLVSYLLSCVLRKDRPVIYCKNPKIRRVYTYIEDVVKQCEDLLSSTSVWNNAIDIASGEVLSVLDIIEQISEVSKFKLDPISAKQADFWKKDAFNILYEGFGINDDIIRREVNKNQKYHLKGINPSFTFKQGISDILEKMNYDNNI